MGLKDLAGRRYDLPWFDTASGTAVRRAATSVPPGDAIWPKPDGLGAEIALYVRRSASH